MELDGAVVVVTGGARGIGRGIVTAMAAEGANIVIGYVLAAPGIKEAADETIAMVERLGPKAIAVACDVRDEQECKSLVQSALNHFGTVDVVCANAGVLSVGPVVELSASEWDRIFAVNTRGVFLTCKAAAPYFIEQKAGVFVNTASIAGKKGSANVSHYCASKFAVIGFTQSLALEMAPHNVRANAICPGYLGTEMWLSDILYRQKDQGLDTQDVFDQIVKDRVPLGRPQTPDDIGQAAVFLCKADNITGEALVVAGGIEMA